MPDGGAKIDTGTLYVIKENTFITVSVAVGWVEDVRPIDPYVLDREGEWKTDTYT